MTNPPKVRSWWLVHLTPFYYHPNIYQKLSIPAIAKIHERGYLSISSQRLQMSYSHTSNASLKMGTANNTKQGLCWVRHYNTIHGIKKKNGDEDCEIQSTAAWASRYTPYRGLAVYRLHVCRLGEFMGWAGRRYGNGNGCSRVHTR